MLLLAASQHHRRLAPLLCFLSLFIGVPLFGVWCHQGVGGGNRDGAHRFLPDAFRDLINNNETEELLMLLAQRRLQAEGNNQTLPLDIDSNNEKDENLPITDEIDSSNETDVTVAPPNSPIPANGCTICKGTTFLPENVPNQNFWPDASGATCRDWQDVILQEMFPNGENCNNDSIYRELFVTCCKLPLPRYQCEQNVHDLLSNRKDYNTEVPPIVSHDEPLVVTTDVVYEYAEDINVVSGTATVGVTINLKWKDPRLAWAIDGTMCADYINLWTGYGNKDALMWVPDFDLLNRKNGLQGLPSQLATLSNDGTVNMVISGPITAMCQFTGLSSIPFDTLGCQFLFGARSRQNANMVHYKLESYCTIKVGKFDAQYNEFLPVPELFEKGYTWYLNTDYSQALYYNFYFRRGNSSSYVRNIVMPTIIFTVLSFCTFLLGTRVGVRLGFSMVLGLVILALQIATFYKIPASSRRLWIDGFVVGSFYWVLLVFLQSLLMGVVFFLREEYEAKQMHRSVLSNTDSASKDPMMELGRAEALARLLETERSQGLRVFIDEDSDVEEETIYFPKRSNNDSTLMTLANTTGAEEDEEPTPVEPERKRKPWFYLCSVRKFDYICMAVAFVSYVVFVVVMSSTNASGGWEKNEAQWHTHDSQWGTADYRNDVPYPYIKGASITL